MSVHIGGKPGDIAERVLLPGDPMRAKWIAETFLEDAVCYTQVRGMLGFTGTWKGERVSVQGSGMGMPSASIYTHELINEYGVKSVIRIGSCGALADDLNLGDVIAAIGSSTDSNMNRYRFEGVVDYAPVADFGLLRTAVEKGEAAGIPIRVGQILAADTFYNDRPDITDRLADYGILAVEMESAAIYTIAARYKAKALTILTVSDHIKRGEAMDSAQREQGFSNMVKIGLDTAIAGA
ncbi:putative purine nucleoside phosphorylase [Actinoplanes missouriensis 431]|uniref:Uridine phosphorylase n=1 Tax=Actinoplanes missouriensis (strain ATCC 14538 / DSM 43046 / CBS 188.64 / JCM 3121 / NBRC 102363 / NCIMB 12654 / NRRL B-3342 / UNCC 431) TaxID=512565 RepID=I0HJ92_ACTM4|nr:purine-nucleoside phosphorylase [Actinoplanes missouriensis]BAL93079.1 putative purine nucleoside phosphorylase [Actinoplanes missouriensis 431]